MLSIARQDLGQLGGRWSVLTRQRADHARLHHLLLRLEEAPGPREQREALLDVQRLVFPHAFAEESVLWPVLRRELDDGEELTLQVEQEHQEVNELVVHIEQDPPAEERAALLARLVTVLREDVRDEEDVLLPRLQQAVGVRRLRQLGVVWEAVRRIAPTRPHPVVARRPPGNVVSALPLTALDRSRDVLEGAALRSPGLAHAMLSGSRGLARLAGRVERLPVMGRGEHPSTHR